MCSISGIYLKEANSLNLKQYLKEMCMIQSHRGPDFEDQWVSKTFEIGLSHTRLSILDLTPEANQPMHSSDQQITLTFNGEIYNWKEIRTEIEKKGISFKTQSDTEVIIEGYKLWGTHIIDKLRGMFAFGLYDHQKKELFCARDRVGKKPFVYTENNNGFAFASEIPALIKIPDCDLTLNHDAIAGMLLHNIRHIIDPYTIYNGIQRLRPGHAMIIKNGKIQNTWNYWTPKTTDTCPTKEEIRNLLEKSIQLRQEADVPVGALLSGGVDSSAICRLISQTKKSPLNTYALGYDHHDEDLIRARKMAKNIRANHKEFYFDPELQFQHFENLLKTYGEPIMLLPLIHTYELCDAIRKDGLKVVLAGHGADELFYGYTGHKRTSQITLLISLADKIPGLSKIISLIKPNHPLSILLKTPAGKRKAALYENHTSIWKSILNEKVLINIKNNVSEECSYWGEKGPNKHYIDESNFIGLMVENTHSVITAGDLPAMMASIEIRMPFLDQELINSAFNIHYFKKAHPFKKLIYLKNILKKSVSDLIPKSLLYAPKRGFGYGIQEEDLLKGPWKEKGDKLFSTPLDADGLFDKEKLKTLWKNYQLGKNIPSSLIAKLFCIQLWLQNNKTN